MADDRAGCCSIRPVVALLVPGRDRGGERVLGTEVRSARLWVSNPISDLQARTGGCLEVQLVMAGGNITINHAKTGAENGYEGKT